MGDAGGRSTRDRLVEEAMRLFGTQGYAGTSVSTIEAAAGLSPGSGSLYRHFASKEQLLAEGIRRQIAQGRGLLAFLADPRAMPDLTLRQRLSAVATAGLRRLEQEADLNRIIVRDLRAFPELLALARDEELGRIHAAVAAWLPTQAAQQRSAEQWSALAAVVIGAISNFWLLTDVFGRHPGGLSEEDYIATLVEVLAGSIEGRAPS